jgi:hypothetical protein
MQQAAAMDQLTDEALTGAGAGNPREGGGVNPDGSGVKR